MPTELVFGAVVGLRVVQAPMERFIMTAEPRPTDTRASEAALEHSLGVLVGFDGSELAALALRHGAAESTRRNIPLTVITSYTEPVAVYANMASMPPENEGEAAKRTAEQTLAEAAELLRDHAGPKNFRTAPGDAAGVLVTLSTGAEVAVVGARGRGGFMGRMLGSVSTALPAHSHCPTIVVPRHSGTGHHSTAEEQEPGPVAVAVDGSEAGRVAMFTAAREASLRGTGLEIVCVLPAGEEWLYWYPDLELSSEVTGRRQKQLQTALGTEAEELTVQFPDLPITTSVPVGDPTSTIVETTGRAQLTVLGTRGRGAVKSALLGSVSRGVLNHAEGPVMIVPS